MLFCYKLYHAHKMNMQSSMCEKSRNLHIFPKLGDLQSENVSHVFHDSYSLGYFLTGRFPHLRCALCRKKFQKIFFSKFKVLLIINVKYLSRDMYLSNMYKQIFHNKFHMSNTDTNSCKFYNMKRIFFRFFESLRRLQIAGNVSMLTNTYSV